MKASDFESPQSPPWIDVLQWKGWVKGQGCSIKLGARHNRTDGEVHYIITRAGKSFELNANYYEWKSRWQEAIDWVEGEVEDE